LKRQLGEFFWSSHLCRPVLRPLPTKAAERKWGSPGGPLGGVTERRATFGNCRLRRRRATTTKLAY
jgi:hypothetical protein